MKFIHWQQEISIQHLFHQSYLQKIERMKPDRKPRKIWMGQIFADHLKCSENRYAPQKKLKPGKSVHARIPQTPRKPSERWHANQRLNDYVNFLTWVLTVLKSMLNQQDPEYKWLQTPKAPKWRVLMTKQRCPNLMTILFPWKIV